MTRMLMRAAYEGAHCSPQSHCDEGPKSGRTAQRLRERRQWSRDWDADMAPEVPEWVDLGIKYAYARMGKPVPEELLGEHEEAGDCDRFGCGGACLRLGGSGSCWLARQETEQDCA